MPSTTKTSRQPPENIFENYTLTKTTTSESGLTNIPDELFTSLPGGTSSALAWGVPYRRIGVPEGSEAISERLLIGFDFHFDQKKYEYFIACTNGWLVLCDPEVNYNIANAGKEQGTLPTIDDVLTGINPVGSLTQFSIRTPGTIKSTITEGTTLLCPWFSDLDNKASEHSLERMEAGLAEYHNSTIGISRGVMSYVDTSPIYGKRTIIRWSSHTFDADLEDRIPIKFEVVLYENGKIEYRYELKSINFGSFSLQPTAVGIFTQGVNRFRDFSPFLGQHATTRNISQFGGAIYDASFTDSVNGSPKPWAGNFNANLNWPAIESRGTVYSFTPPVNKRKVLPKLEQNKSNNFKLPFKTVSNNNTAIGGFGMFDDRRSLSFTETEISLPSTLPIFKNSLNSDNDLINRVNLYSNDIKITGSVQKSAIENFIRKSQNQESPDPFNESNRPGLIENDDLFFTTTSNENLPQPLKSKSQIKFTLKVDTDTKTLNSSSLYYFNYRQKRFLVPYNSRTVDPFWYTQVGELDGPATVGGDSDLATIVPQALNGKVIEDQIGFGPIGNFVASGSNDPTEFKGFGTNVYVNKPYTPTVANEAIQQKLNKSITINENYKATIDETFSLPIQQPFVLEKAVITVPFKLGDGWFKDYTMAYRPHMGPAVAASLGRTTTFDMGGPGITLALMNQVKTGDETRRDLIMSSTITHGFDNKSELVLRNLSGTINEVQILKEGFNAYGTPGGVVEPNNSSSIYGYEFTGSGRFECQPAISNGNVLSFTKELNGVAATNRDEVRGLLSTETLNLISSSGVYANGINIAYINPLGRSCEGFNQAGRSVFGKEYTTNTDKSIPNPFYTDDQSKFEPIIAAQSVFTAQTALNLNISVPSPYIIHPGDDLVLSLSKTRPFLLSADYASVDQHSGSIEHNVTFASGNIEVTFYGSLLSEYSEVNDHLKQSLNSNSINEIIGNEPVLDQFELEYCDELIGTSFDNYVTGTLVTKSKSINNTTILTTGSRGKVFSKFNARNQPVPDDTLGETSTNPSKAFRFQPWYERVGNTKTARLTNFEERYYDSMMPAVDQIIARDGSVLFFDFLNSPIVPAYVRDGVDSENTIYTIFGGNLNIASNKNLHASHPYEPRYSGISRLKNIKTSFKSSLSGPVLTFNDISLKAADNLCIIYATKDSAQASEWNLTSDVNISSVNKFGFYTTSSADLNDTSKILFGFNDNSTLKYDPNDANNEFIGTPNIPTFAESQTVWSQAGIRTLIKPTISGWKYGVWSGIPSYSSLHFRLGKYGQFRDLLEQRLFTTCYNVPEKNSNKKEGVQLGPVVVKFIDAAGALTNPENTSAHNLNIYSTSSLPYFDGLALNRPSINQSTQNTNIITVGSDEFNNIDVN